MLNNSPINQGNINQSNNKSIVNHILNPDYQGIRSNIHFKKATGFSVMMNIPQIAKMDDIIKEYFSVVGLPTNSFKGKKIYFLFNGRRINENDLNRTAQEIGITQLSNITVIDTQNLIGA